jgi:hypothetical protein
MNRTALEHDLVTGYLSDLEAALRGMPQYRVRELVEQISGHLADALPPGASDQEIITALQRLGSAAELAAEERAAGGTPATPPRPRRALPAGVRRRLWMGAALVVVLALVGWRLADPYLSAGPLQLDGLGDWWSPQDARHEVISQADDVVQNMTPGRYDQRQGYVISVLNPTTVAQTIIGDAAGQSTAWNNPGSGSEQITVSHAGLHIPGGMSGVGIAGQVRYFPLPVVIPPVQTRLVRVFWITSFCGSGVDKLALRVRVGWFIRTEVIPQEDWVLGGLSSSNLCQGQKPPTAGP